MFGGHETTASTATSLVMFLGLHTEVVERLRQELVGLQEERGVDLQNLTMETLDQLQYTGCVIKETLRINPPVPGGFRVALKTFELNVSPRPPLRERSGICYHPDMIYILIYYACMYVFMRLGKLMR